MTFWNKIRRIGIVGASAASIVGAAWALPAPVETIWKNPESTAAQVAAAITQAATAPADIIAMANEMVLAAVLLSTANPPAAVKGVIAACSAGSDPDAVAADPQGAKVLADACEEAAAELGELGLLSAAQQAQILQSTTTIRGGGGGTETELEVDVEVEPENPGTDTTTPDTPMPDDDVPSES